MTVTENLPAVRGSRALTTTNAYADLPNIVSLADRLQKAEGMVPRAYLNNPGKILAAILTGRELGIEPMASLRAFHVVEGKPCADYSFWIARLKASGYRVEWLHRSNEKVVLQLTAPDGAKHVETWDKARAVTAGLWNGRDTWKKYPETMLTARCVTTAGRAFAGEVMYGCYELDEADDLASEAAPATGGNSQPQDLGTAVGVEPDEAQQLAEKVTAKVQLCGYTPSGLGDLCKELKLEGVKGKRLSSFPVEALRALDARLSKELAFETVEQAVAAIEKAEDLPALEKIGTRVAASGFVDEDAATAERVLGERATALRHGFTDEEK